MMPLPAILFAQTPYDRRMESMRKAFERSESGTSEMMNSLGVVLGVLGIVAIVLLLGRALQQRSALPAAMRPVKFFSKMLKQLGVGLPDRIMMRCVARRSGLGNPTLMLFSRELLLEHGGHWADRLALAAFRRRSRRRIEALAEVLFEEVSPAGADLEESVSTQ